MNRKSYGLLRQRYDAFEHMAGVVVPLLCVLSIMDYFGLLRWAWVLLFWLSCGHWSIYLYNAYPRLKYGAFSRGLFVFGVGMLWPVWCAPHLYNKKRR